MTSCDHDHCSMRALRVCLALCLESAVLPSRGANTEDKMIFDVHTSVYIHIWLSVKTLESGSGPGTPFDSYPDPYSMDHGLGSDPYPKIHTPDPYPEYMNRLKMSWGKPTNAVWTLTDHLPCRAGFSSAIGEYIHIF